MKPIIRALLLISFLYILTSCQEETKCNLGQDEIVDYVLSIDNSRDDDGLRKEFSQFEVIIKIENKEFITFPIDYLDGLHDQKKFRNLSYSEFICLLINEKLELPEKIIGSLPDIYTLSPNEDTLLNLNNLGIEAVLKKYDFLKNNNGIIYTKKNEDIDSLVYFFYKKGFLFLFSGIEDKVFFLKPEQIPDFIDIDG